MPRQKRTGPYISDAERPTILMRLQGMQFAQIAQVLGKSHKTLKNQMTVVYRRFGVKSILGVYHALLACNIITAEDVTNFTPPELNEETL